MLAPKRLSRINTPLPKYTVYVCILIIQWWWQKKHVLTTKIIFFWVDTNPDHDKLQVAVGILYQVNYLLPLYYLIIMLSPFPELSGCKVCKPASLCPCIFFSHTSTRLHGHAAVSAASLRGCVVSSMASPSLPVTNTATTAEKFLIRPADTGTCVNPMFGKWKSRFRFIHRSSAQLRLSLCVIYVFIKWQVT